MLTIIFNLNDDSWIVNLLLFFLTYEKFLNHINSEAFTPNLV